MSEPRPTLPDLPSPSGGEQRRRLDRAPAERYGGGKPVPGTGPGDGPSQPSAARSIAAAVLVAGAGAVLWFLLGLMDLGPGLIVVAAFIGWATALALVWRGRKAAIADARARTSIAAFLGIGAIAAGILLDWLFALTQGGVLGPLDYVAQRYGPVALLAVLVAGAVAAYRAR